MYVILQYAILELSFDQELKIEIIAVRCLFLKNFS